MLKVLDLFSGIGGFSIGLEKAGFETVAFCEIEPYCRGVLERHWPDTPIYGDVKQLTGEQLRADGIVPDVIVGGYPCQPFSVAGRQRGEEDPRHLWPYIREHIYTIQPARVFLENVEGHISMGLSSVISDLEEDSYGATWGIFSAREVGAPHQRKRVYIMADTESQRVQRLRASGEQKPGAYGEAELSVCQDQRPQQANWQPEPGVGSVVDGCADRVDRIRLLGNGVVPQTAAKAWQVLSSRLEGL